MENIKANTDYKIVIEVLENTLSGILSINPDNTVFHGSEIKNIQVTQTGTLVFNAHTRADLENATFDIWFSHSNSITGTFKCKIMVTENTDTNYEEYGTMPSMEFLSEIKNCENSINFTICNKNLFNKENYNLVNGYLQGNSIIAESSNNIIYIQCLANMTYTVSKKAGKRFTVAYSNILPTAGITVSGTILNNTAESITITTSAEAKYLIVYIRNGNVAGELTLQEVLDSLQIEENEKQTNYIEHKEQNYTFPLKQKLHKGDYLAEDGIHHKRKQIELDGTENWNITGNNYYVGIEDKVSRTTLTKGKILCSHFKETTGGSTGEIKTGEFFEGYYVSGNRNIFFNYDDGVGGVENFKTYLAQQKANGTPVVLEYETEEELEEYNEEQKRIYNEIMQTARTYKEKTHIFSTDEISPILDVEWIKDTNIVLNNINKAITGGN